MSDLTKLSEECYSISFNNGFWDSFDSLNPRDVLVKLALIHSEVSEALEEAREGNQEKLNQELIDVLIRTLDLLGAREVEVDRIFNEKMTKNKNRPYKHGKLL